MFFVNLAVYFLVIMIICQGHRLSRVKDNSHEDITSEASFTSLRGLAVILIVFLFMSKEQAFVAATQIQIFHKIGLLLIAVYFFCSGYEIIKKLNTKQDYFHGTNRVRTVFEILAPLCVTVFMCELYYLIAVIIGFIAGVYFAKRDRFIPGFFKKNRRANRVTAFFGKYAAYTYVLCLIPVFVFRFMLYRNRKPYFELFNINIAVYIVAVLTCTALMIILADRIFCKKQKADRERESKRFLRIVRRVALSLVMSILLTAVEGTAYYFTSPSLLFIGHASVKLRTSSGKVIYIDPYYPTQFNYSEPADYILVTHAHSDHNKVSLCRQNADCKIITWRESLINKEYKVFEDDEIKIEAVPGGGRGIHTASANVGYIVSFDGISVYHSADCDFTEDKYYLKDKDIDYALYTVNDVYTMGPEEAAEMANYIGARVNIPIHGDDDNYGKQRKAFDADGYMKLFINQLIFLN